LGAGAKSSTGTPPAAVGPPSEIVSTEDGHGRLSRQSNFSTVAELDAALVEAAAEAANTGAPKIDLASGAVTIQVLANTVTRGGKGGRSV